MTNYVDDFTIRYDKNLTVLIIRYDKNLTVLMIVID